MELRQMEYVIAVVEHGTFRAAAEAVGVSQPSLSQGIKALESQLGVALFHRLARGVILTPAGEAFVAPARQSLRAASVAREAAADVAGLHGGRLDVVCLPTLAVSPTAELVGAFRRRYADVAVRIVQPETMADVAERVRTGDCEIGLGELVPGDEDLDVHELSRQDIVVLVPAGEAPDSGRLTVRQLARSPIITTPAGTSTRLQLEQAFAEAGIDPIVAVETDHREALVALVASGAGVAIVPRPWRNRTPAGTHICELRPALSRRVGILHRRGPRSPAAQAFLALAVPGRPARAERPRPRRQPATRSS